MLSKIRTAAISAIVGLGALAALPATAQADSFYFGIGPAGPSAGVVIEGGHSYHRPRHWDRWDRWDRRTCSPGEAVRKASRMGIHRANVRRVTPRAIVVSGRKHRHHVTVRFGRFGNCPIIG
jgi:hypothetical protein